MKRITALLLAAVMVFCMTSCEKKSKGDGENETTTDVSAKVAKTTAAPVDPELTNGVTRELADFAGKKLIAFTFDDGPYTPVTESLLERLDQFNARVTFFVLGERLDEDPEYKATAKKAYEMGNQIASHTYSHATLTDLTEEELIEDIEKANKTLKETIGIEPGGIRPPYGATNETVERAMNKHIILWNIDSLDWQSRNAVSVCNTIVYNASDGGIVLLHDLYQTSVDGAIMAMEILQNQGYAFVTVNEMAKLRGLEMDNTTKYFEITETTAAETKQEPFTGFFAKN